MVMVRIITLHPGGKNLYFNIPGGKKINSYYGDFALWVKHQLYRIMRHYIEISLEIGFTNILKGGDFIIIHPLNDPYRIFFLYLMSSCGWIFRV